ncbi:hypothetical protein B0H63DRAFT_539983 [Podospora didyma]|uniref:Uncharacterized protein n=1 Tax=Podospora didyma TaxID=330526 RepID=A0AAE0P0X3_9PEZI|nr:hypothetical protein B0H63DRAFT_539983 [Podospora didyma]
MPLTEEAYRIVAPFIFDSVQGLLKLWPDSYSPNGHSIVAGAVPPGTVLHHARHGPGTPKKPTFFAFDATKRPLNIIYLDGQSATLTSLGTLNSQMALLQGKVPLYPKYNLTYDDDQRALDLCKLVAELGVDGVVRMNAGFEILVCDYAASQVRELFITNITVTGSREEGPEGLPRDKPPRGIGNVFSEQSSYEWLRSASWHYGSDGNGGIPESRVSLDICCMISFYNPSLSSLANSHHGGIPADAALVKSWLRDIASPKSGGAAESCSSVNWQALFATANSIVTKIHELTHATLAPYLEYVWTNAGNLEKLGRSRVLLYNSLNVVMKKLCTWERELFEWSEEHTTTTTVQPTDLSQLQQEVRHHHKKSKDILAWMGWDSWTKCDRRCQLNEICAIPTWPVIYAPGLPQGGIYAAHPQNLSDQQMLEFWQPKCINRTDFDRGGWRGRDPIYQFPDVPPY